MSSLKFVRAPLLAAALAWSAAHAQLQGGSNPGQSPVLEVNPNSSCTSPLSSVMSQQSGDQSDDMSVLNSTTSTVHDALFISVVIDGVSRLFAVHVDLPAAASVHFHVHFNRPVGNHGIQICGSFPPGGGGDAPNPVIVDTVIPAPPQ